MGNQTEVKELLTELTGSLGIHQAQVAGLIGVHLVSVSRWVGGAREPTETALRLLRLLRWTVRQGATLTELSEVLEGASEGEE